MNLHGNGNGVGLGEGDKYRSPSGLLAVLLSQPDVFASVANELSLGQYRTFSQSFTLAPNEVRNFLIDNPVTFLTLLINLQVSVSSPVVEMKVIKDNRTDVTVDSFSIYDNVLPNMYTPIRNQGSLMFTNLSGVSSPSVTFVNERMQMKGDYWDRLWHLLFRDITDPIVYSERKY